MTQFHGDNISGRVGHRAGVLASAIATSAAVALNTSHHCKAKDVRTRHSADRENPLVKQAAGAAFFWLDAKSAGCFHLLPLLPSVGFLRLPGVHIIWCVSDAGP